MLCISVPLWRCVSVFSASPCLCGNVYRSSLRLRLEREPEHDLRNPHEPGLDVRLAEVRVAERARAAQRADVDAVEQVQHLDFQLRRLAAAQAEVLDEDGVGVVLGR